MTPTLTVRNIPRHTVRFLKALARRKGHSVAQEVRDLLEISVSERTNILGEIEAGWRRQRRRPRAGEIDRWIATGRGYRS